MQGKVVPHAEGNHQAQENQQQAEEAPTAPTVNRLDRFLAPVINSAFPELITGVVSIGRAGIGITDGFITGSIPLAASTVGIGCLGIADYILYFVSNSATRSRGQELFSLSSLERKPHMLLCEPTQLNKVALGTKYKSNTRGRNRERTSLPTSIMLG